MTRTCARLFLHCGAQNLSDVPSPDAFIVCGLSFHACCPLLMIVIYKEKRKQNSLRLRVMDRGLGFCPLEKLSVFPSAETRISILRMSILQLELVVKSMLEPSTVGSHMPKSVSW